MSCVLAVCLLGALLYFGYQVTQTSLRYSKAQEIREKWFANDQAPGPQDIEEALAETDAALKKYGSAEFKSLKAEFLLYKAWYFPEESIKPLRTSLPLALEVYRDSENYRDTAGWQVAWSLSYAHLPTRLERWVEQVRVQAPYMRPSLAMLQMGDEVLLDNVDGVRPAVERELEGRENYIESKVVAIEGLLIIDDVDAAVRLEPPMEEQRNLNTNQLMVLTNLSMETQHFAQARAQLKIVDESMANDPSVALTHALVEIALDGVNSGPAARWIDLAAQSTRRSITREGVTALIYGELERLTGDEKWLEELKQLVEQYPNDYDAQAAMAYLRLRKVVDVGLEGSKAEQLEAVNELVSLFEHVRALAGSEVQRQEACFMLAEACTVASVYAGNAGDDAGAQDALDEAMGYLRQGLGDPEVTDAVISECPPGYSDFLLNDLVRAARVRWPEFDTRVHECIIDYLNRRIDIFSDIPGLKPMEHLPYSAGARAAEQPPQDGAPEDHSTEPGSEDSNPNWQPA